MSLYVDDGYLDTGYVQTGVEIIWGNKEIFVPRTSMLLTQTVPSEIRQLDINDFRKELKNLEDSDPGIVSDDTHSHQPPTVVAGVSLARVVEIINDYSITFEDGLYTVNVVGGNSNISDKVNKNTVGVNTANSAGLQDLSSLQAASFGDGAVSIDQANGVSGLTYPRGTKSTPSNNWADARAIAESRNMTKLLVLGNATAGAGDNLANLTVVGSNPMLSTLTIDAAADTQGLYIKELYFTGALDGGSILRDAVLGEVEYFDGYVEHCVLTPSTVYINGRAVIIDSSTGYTYGLDPKLDLTNSTELAVRGYQGNLMLINKVNNDKCVIELDGVLTIDASCTTGTIEVYGDGHVINNGTVTVVDRTTGSPVEIAAEVWSHASRELTTNVSSLDETDIHMALDSYTNKGDYKADVSNLSADVNVVAVAGEAVSGLGDLQTSIGDIHVALDTYVNKELWKEHVHEDEIHFALDTYANKDTYKADVSALNVTADVTKVAGVDVTIDDFKADLSGVDNAAVLAAIAGLNDLSASDVASSVWNWGTRGLTDKLNFNLTPAERSSIATATEAALLNDGDGQQLMDAILQVINGNLDLPAVEIALIADAVRAELSVELARLDENVSSVKDSNVVSVNGTAVTNIDQFKADTAGLGSSLADDVWNSAVRTLTSSNANITHVRNVPVTDINDFLVPNLTEAEVHQYLDTYVNKDDWKDSSSDITPVLDAIAALNNVSLLDIETSNALAKSDALASIASAVGNIPTTDSVADLTPVLVAISGLNDVTPAEVRAAFDEAEFKDKNTELEVHTWLDSYVNKDSWKADVATIESEVVALVNYDDTALVGKIDGVQSDVTASKVHTDSLVNVDVHTELDTYANKADWKADVSPFSDVLTAIDALDTEVKQVIKDVTLGSWKIDGTQMVMKDTDGVEIARFDLLDSSGNPTSTTVFERRRV